MASPDDQNQSKIFSTKGFAVLQLIDFTFDRVSKDIVQGRFVVSQTSCQSVGVLHGGIIAYIAESLGSVGAGLASRSRCAGIKLNVHHLCDAQLGEEVLATATPILVGNRIQVWEIKFSASKEESSSSKHDPPKVYAVSKLTALVGMAYDKSFLEILSENLTSSL